MYSDGERLWWELGNKEWEDIPHAEEEKGGEIRKEGRKGGLTERVVYRQPNENKYKKGSLNSTKKSRGHQNYCRRLGYNVSPALLRLLLLPPRPPPPDRARAGAWHGLPPPGVPQEGEGAPRGRSPRARIPAGQRIR